MTGLTMEQARRFILMKQGLLGDYRFRGKEGALAYIRQAGCIQFDPVDVCGRNAELTLESRVKGFRKQMLEDLLYRDRALVDYCDKELSIWPVEDWPYFSPCREKSRALGKTFARIPELSKAAEAYIRENGPVSSRNLPIEGTVFWHSSMHWSGNWEKESKAARSVLEQLYTDGVLLIHHKNGSRKFYDLAEKYIAPEILQRENPCRTSAEWIRWRVLRRIGAVGLLWNRKSDAFLGIGMNNEEREEAFRKLMEEGSIQEIFIEGCHGSTKGDRGRQGQGIKSPLYMRAEDAPLLQEVIRGDQKFRKRLEFLAPLDPMLWDRKLIAALFGFHYSWEIYTPKEKRKYGCYVLPILYGEKLIGRIEMAADAGEGILTIRKLWLEEDVRKSKALESALERSLRRFAAFNLCESVVWEKEGFLRSP